MATYPKHAFHVIKMLKSKSRNNNPSMNIPWTDPDKHENLTRFLCLQILLKPLLLNFYEAPLFCMLCEIFIDSTQSMFGAWTFSA